MNLINKNLKLKPPIIAGRMYHTCHTKISKRKAFHINYLKIALILFLILNFINPSNAKEIRLSEAKVIEETIKKNLDIKITQTQLEEFKYELPSAKSIYDTNLAFKFSYYEDRSERISAAFGTETNNTQWNLSASQLTPLGTQMTVAFLNDRDRTNSIFANDNLLYNSRFETTLRQPISQNYFGYQNRKGIQSVKEQIKAIEFQSRYQLDTILFRVLTTYWQSYASYFNLQFESEAWNKAKELYTSNQKKEEIGLIEGSDLYAFAANQNIRESLYIEAKNNLLSSTQDLKTELRIAPNDKIRLSNESFKKEPVLSPEAALKKAFENRGDYLSLKRELESLNLQVKIKKNSRWPQVDLVASLTVNGIDPDYENAFDDIGDGNPAWGTGIEFSIPITNRKARSSYQQSKFQKYRKLLELKRKEDEIKTEVIEKIEIYKNSLRKMNITSQARQNQYQKLKGELKKYEQGRSDSDILIRFQNDYIDSKRIALQAQVDYKIALLEMKKSQGVLTSDYINKNY